jgi:outer membrane biosynthesis protein TonB
VKDDSRANYADIVNVDPDAQVMVVGDVVKYFDRVRRNVNKAYMRQTLRTALEKYQADKAANTARPASIMESVDGDHGGAECGADTYTLNESPTEDEMEKQEPSVREPSIREPSIKEPSIREPSIREQPEKSERRERRQRRRRSSAEKEATLTSQPSATPLLMGPRVSTPYVAIAPPEEDSGAPTEGNQLKPQKGEYDLRSMHNVAMAGLN